MCWFQYLFYSDAYVLCLRDGFYAIVCNGCSFIGYSEDLTFVRVEFHLPGGFPLGHGLGRLVTDVNVLGWLL